MADSSYQTYAIKGIPIEKGQPIPERQELTKWFNDWENNKHEISLFILAMEKFMATPVDERLSFYQIAGIHSYPAQSWDNAPDYTQRKGNPFPGYCSHNLTSFPMWHRPYVLLYEQVIHKNMMTIIDEAGIKSANEKQKWRSAAQRWRLPYWDWARKETYIKDFGYPLACVLSHVRVIRPGNRDEEWVKNPLVKFTNPSGKPMGDPETMGKRAMFDNIPHGIPEGKKPAPSVGTILRWSKCIGTSRYGIFEDEPNKSEKLRPDRWKHGVNNWEAANQSLKTPQGYGHHADFDNTLNEAVSRMFNPEYHTKWETFASTEFDRNINGILEPQLDYISLEYIHNIVHDRCGGTFINEAAKQEEEQEAERPSTLSVGLGHMADVPVAAFDPIFWFHHCNVDRLCAIFQTLRPNWWYDSKTPEQPNDPMLPFSYDTEGHFWTANKAQVWLDLNYHYDDLPGAHEYRKNSTDVGSERIEGYRREYLQKIYPGTGRRLEANFQLQVGNQQPQYFTDYVINIVYDRYAMMGRSYSILFFLADDDNETDWNVSSVGSLSNYRHAAGYLGSIYTFSAPATVNGKVACGNCDDQSSAGVLSNAQIPIAVPLLRWAKEWELGTQSTGDGAASPFSELDPCEELDEALGKRVKMVFVEIGGNVVDPAQNPRLLRTQAAILRTKALYTPDEGTTVYGTPMDSLDMSIQDATDNATGDNYKIVKKLVGPGVTEGQFGDLQAEWTLYNDDWFIKG